MFITAICVRVRTLNTEIRECEHVGRIKGLAGMLDAKMGQDSQTFSCG
jgi:hypothetical protein